MLPGTVKPPKRYDDKEIGARIRKARRTKTRLSTEAFAPLVHIGAEALYKKERGDAPFYLEELNRICERLEAPYLFPFLEWGEALLVERLLRDQSLR
jgi:hypothetical protein